MYKHHHKISTMKLYHLNQFWLHKSLGNLSHYCFGANMSIHLLQLYFFDIDMSNIEIVQFCFYRYGYQTKLSLHHRYFEPLM